MAGGLEGSNGNRVLLWTIPVLKGTIWGGRRLEEYGYTLPRGGVGECWAISAHPGGDCLIANAPYKGRTLSWLWDNRRDIFGGAKGDVFPILTKIIDARDNCSIQVHPSDEYAKIHENGSLGKTECWYVLDALEGTNIVIGHNARTRNEMRSMIEGARWDDFIREVPVHKGDFFYVSPGTLHTIKGGTMILETQENSDITYRVYDYGRKPGGIARELHLKESMEVLECPYINVPPPLSHKTRNTNMRELLGCDLFSVWKLDVSGTDSIKQDQRFMLASIIDGGGTVDGIECHKGAHFIIPYDYGSVDFKGNMSLILSAPA